MCVCVCASAGWGGGGGGWVTLWWFGAREGEDGSAYVRDTDTEDKEDLFI